MNHEQSRNERTLDPDDWESLRVMGHQMVDDMVAYLRTVRDRPLRQPMPDAVKETFRRPLPIQPQALEQIYEEYSETILPYPDVNLHPRSWGWVIGTGTPAGMLADMLASGLNSGLCGGDQARTLVELQAMDWCKQMLGFPREASGLFVSGCSMANLIALTVARNTKASIDIRQHGLQGLTRRMVLYASQEVHSSIQKAVELLGLGSVAFRSIPVDDNYSIDLDALRHTIRSDRAEGHQPFCVVGCAGTAATGAIDDLEQLAEICQQEELWFHVDGAFGALVALAPALRPLVAGMERADSLAFDLHKWLHMPYEVGCVLVRSHADHIRAFALNPHYLQHVADNPVTGAYWASDYGIELSSGFRALKVWFLLKTYGVETYGHLIQQNVEQAHYLAEQIARTPRLELLVPVSLNVICFRYRAAGLDEPALNQLNERLLSNLQQGGIVMLSNVTIQGKSGLRAAITNHRSRRDDFDVLVAEVVRIGGDLLKQSG